MKDKDAETIYLVTERTELAWDQEDVTIYGAYRVEHVAQMFRDIHTDALSMSVEPVTLDAFVDYLYKGESPWEVIVTREGELLLSSRINYSEMEYDGKWTIASEGIRIRVIATSEADAMIKALAVLQEIRLKGRV